MITPQQDYDMPPMKVNILRFQEGCLAIAADSRKYTRKREIARINVL